MRCIYQSDMWCAVLRVPAREVSIWFHPQRVVPNHLPGHISNLLSAAWLAPGLEHLVCLQASTPIAPKSIVGVPHILLGLQVRSNHISTKKSDQVSVPHMFSPHFLGSSQSSPAPPAILAPRTSPCASAAAAPCAASAAPRRCRAPCDAWSWAWTAANGCRMPRSCCGESAPWTRNMAWGEHAVKQWLEYVGMGYSFKETQRSEVLCLFISIELRIAIYLGVVGHV